MGDNKKLFKQVYVKDCIYQEVKKGILNDPTSKETVEIIKSYDLDEDMAVMLIIEIAQLQEDTDTFGGFL
ncbi:hypothetical protein [Mammaliicoccus sp. A-M4]|uniref:hypothetical protein n=1 Tax=Mammaliicoccus sp. A-M4 TaxID=2898664 RepID=UPI001EFA520D|nr:hypothetical protein [Mammaliicoccus sp. A-M4]